MTKSTDISSTRHDPQRLANRNARNDAAASGFKLPVREPAVQAEPNQAEAGAEKQRETLSLRGEMKRGVSERREAPSAPRRQTERTTPERRDRSQNQPNELRDPSPLTQVKPQMGEAAESPTAGMSKGNKRAVRRQLGQINTQFNQVHDQLLVDGNRADLTALLSQINQNLIILTRQMSPGDKVFHRGSGLSSPAGKLSLQDISLTLRSVLSRLPEPNSQNTAANSGGSQPTETPQTPHSEQVDASLTKIFSQLVQVLHDLDDLEQMSVQGFQNERKGGSDDA